jgi:hypothetical protein
MQKYLDIGAASFAFVAAVFWFLSAFRTVPPMISYWGSTPENDPYLQAVKFSAAMNTLASCFSGVSAFCMGLKLFIRE